MQLIGPFSQVLTMDGLPYKGGIPDEALEIIPHAGILVNNGIVMAIGSMETLMQQCPRAEMKWQEEPQVLLPGFIDAHTHICFAGSRVRDFAMRNAGKSYLDIARAGGGIQDTVQQTRNATQEELEALMTARVRRMIHSGITTIEAKSGYGLSTEEELKILRVIRAVNDTENADVIATCLAAHMKPADFPANEETYLANIAENLFRYIKREDLTNRIDIFVEETAFSPVLASPFLQQANALGFDCTVHADQFTTGGSAVAVDCGAVSADHLDASTDKEIELLAKSDTVATVLPGASLGLGTPFAPARKLLDAGCCLAIASDWNPGSAPMGDLLIQASIISTYEKLTAAECLAALTYRAAKALKLNNKGKIKRGIPADMQSYPVADYREILYFQGTLKPNKVWKNGKLI